MKLLTSQKNEIFEIIDKESSLDPNQFEFEEVESRFSSIPIATKLKFKSDQYFFIFETRDSRPFAIFSPGKESFFDEEFPGTWPGEVQYFHSWLRYLEKEVTIVDKWKLLEQEASNVDFKLKNESGYFSIQEYDLLSLKLDELKLKIEDLQIPAEQVRKIQESLEDLKAQAKKLNKVDWKNIFIGTIISLMMEFAFAPEKATDLWAIIKQTFTTFLITN